MRRGGFFIVKFYNPLVNKGFPVSSVSVQLWFQMWNWLHKIKPETILSASKGDTDRTDASCETPDKASDTTHRMMWRCAEKLHRSGEAVGRRQGTWAITQRVRRSEPGIQTETVRDSSRCWDRTQINGSHDALMPQAPGRQVTPPTQLFSHRDYIPNLVNVSPNP